MLTITYERSGHLTHIRLNRPEVQKQIRTPHRRAAGGARS
jgi:hypothetical protein